MKDWKAGERRVAELLGGQRIPVSGRGRGGTPDIEHDRLGVEVKARAAFPAWLEDALRQTELSTRDGKTPVAGTGMLWPCVGFPSSRIWSGLRTPLA